MDPVVARRRRILGWTAVVVGGLAAVGTVLAVYAPGAVEVAETTVLLDARPFTCADPHDVTTRSDDTEDEDERIVVPAIRMHPGLDCTMDVIVRNDGDQDVSVDRITIPMAGPESAVGLRADRAFTQGIGPSGGADALDAVFDYAGNPRSGGPFLIGAGSAQRFEIHLSWSDGCMDDGSAITFTSAPSAVVSAGPWHVERTWDGAGYAALGGEHTLAASCP